MKLCTWFEPQRATSNQRHALYKMRMPKQLVKELTIKQADELIRLLITINQRNQIGIVEQ
jgi:hypothetical protein